MNRRKSLSTVTALDLLTTVGVHSLVTTQVGELRVRLETDFALERLDAAVDVLMLLQAARCRKRLAAFGARKRASARMVGADVFLKAVRMRECIAAVLAVVRLLAVMRVALLLTNRMHNFVVVICQYVFAVCSGNVAMLTDLSMNCLNIFIPLSIFSSVCRKRGIVLF